jgi:hypothetical protein
MRSLWRILALQWLGGEGSEALTGDSTILEGLLDDVSARRPRAFDVRPEAQASRQVMLVLDLQPRSDAENPTEGSLRSGQPDYSSR